MKVLSMLVLSLGLLFLSSSAAAAASTTRVGRPGGSPGDQAAHVVIFACTPAGFAAALGAKAAGKEKGADLRVIVMEPSPYCGGMAGPGGIGLRDCEHDEIRANNSTQHQWGMRNAAKYNVSKPVWQPDAWRGEETFVEMLEEAGVELWRNTTFVEGPAGVEKNGTELKRVLVEGYRGSSPFWLDAEYWIDASYEGELAVAAGATTVFGREARSTYGESFAGITNGSAGQFHPPISPFVETDGKVGEEEGEEEGEDQDPRTPLPFVQNGPDPRTRVGSSDSHLMAYSYRACLTTEDPVALEAPPGYDPQDFELARRYIKAELADGKTPSEPWGNLAYHDGGANLPATDAWVLWRRRSNAALRPITRTVKYVDSLTSTNQYNSLSKQKGAAGWPPSASTRRASSEDTPTGRERSGGRLRRGSSTVGFDFEQSES